MIEYKEIESILAIIRRFGSEVFYIGHLSKEDFEIIIAQKDAEILNLKSQVDKLNQQNEVMVESFRISSDLLIERLKDLESVNFAGDRPQTAQVLGRINPNDNGAMKRPRIMDDISPPDILNLENEGNEELSEEHVWTNWREIFSKSEFAKHTIECIRNTKKCKICQESVPKNKLKDHLLDWRKSEKMIAAIEEDDDETMLMMHNHGAKAEALLDKKSKQKPIHYIAIHGSVRCLLVLMGKGLEELSPLNADGETPLNISIKNNQTIIAKSLIELGADLEIKDSSMRTPLMNACLFGNLEIVKKLLNEDADWKTTNAINDTWITLAQKSKNTDIVMLLVEKGASLRPSSSSLKGKKNTLIINKIHK